LRQPSKEDHRRTSSSPDMETARRKMHLSRGQATCKLNMAREENKRCRVLVRARSCHSAKGFANQMVAG
jgi:hypothetical protein